MAKYRTTAFFILCVYVHSISAGKLGKELSHLAHGAFTHLFNHHYVPTQSFGCSLEERKRQLELFKYDLGIEYRVHTKKDDVKTERRALMYFHPWGFLGLPNKRHTQLMKSYDVLPGDVITFNFPDGVWKGPLPIFNTSLGQISDVLPAIYTLNYVLEKTNLEAVDLFGYSRGGAVAVNMIAVLNDTTGQFDTALASIGISKAQRERMLRVVQKGSIVLNCPLIDGNATLNGYNGAVRFLAKNVTKYKENGLQCLQSAKTLANLKLNVLIHFQHNDKRVLNVNEADLYAAFAKHNPDSTFLVLGNDGGHVHSQESLASAIHRFYKDIGAAHNSKRAEQYSGQITRSQSKAGKLLQPTLSEVEPLISEYHASCAKKKR